MRSVSRIKLNGHRGEKQHAREAIAQEAYDVRERMVRLDSLLSHLSHTPLSIIDRKVKHGEYLSFEEAFCGMCFILAGTNLHFFEALRSDFEKACGGDFPPERALASGVAFAQLMAAKESFSELTPEEVAGMATAGMLDQVLWLDFGSSIETSGMGGDIGFVVGGTIMKTINASTLSSLVLAAAGLNAVKHGSYSNTSAVGSTEAIELFGARISPRTTGEVYEAYSRSGYCFMDAHWCKTMHDLSHLIMIETINHVVGPMTAPLSPAQSLTKVMGVNEKVHPEVVARAYAILHSLGIQQVGGVAILTGLDESGAGTNPLDHSDVKRHSILDELSPFSSVVSLAHGGNFLGTFLLEPSHFGIEIEPETVRIINNQESIQRANILALRGRSGELADYLAMNAAIGFFADRYLNLPDAVGPDGPNRDYLRQSFAACREVIAADEPWRVLEAYVQATGGVLECVA